MKKVLGILAVAILVLSFSAGVFAADPTVSFSGYQWLRYSLLYSNDKETNSAFSIERTYISTNVKADDYEAKITIDMPNTQYGESVNTAAGAAAQGAIDWASWIKAGYVDLINVPGLKDVEARVRLGIQPVYFGTIDTWQYVLIDKALEDYLGKVSSTDDGVAVLGYLPMQLGNFEVGYYNGTGYKKVENDLDKEIVASINIIPITGFYARGSYYSNHFGENQISATTGQPTPLNKMTSRSAAVVGFASGPVEGFVEYLVTKDPKVMGVSTGIGQAIDSFLKLNVIGNLDMALRYFTVNPDTEVVRDEYNVYTVGFNYRLAPKVLLQLNYEMKQDKFGGAKSPVNANQWLMQTKWEY
jgi:hypothetical protein